MALLVVLLTMVAVTAVVVIAVILKSSLLTQSTPVGPSFSSGVLDGGSYLHLLWPSGAWIVVWDDNEEGGMMQAHGTSESDNPVFRTWGGSVSADNNNMVLWNFTVDTVDGIPGPVMVNGQEYSISDGNYFFLIQTKTDEQQGHVTQIRKYYTVCLAESSFSGCDYDNYVKAQHTDPDLAAFYDSDPDLMDDSLPQSNSTGRTR